MYETITEPDRQIAKRAVKMWRISNTIGHAIEIIITIVLFILDSKFDWYDWVPYVLWISLGLGVISAIWSILIEPTLVQKYWRYGIDKEFVKLRHGKWNIHHQLIPMSKVQYVGLEQGPLLRKFNLYTVSIGTMGSTHEIPAIPDTEAKELRDQIAVLAKIKEVEQ